MKTKRKTALKKKIKYGAKEPNEVIKFFKTKKSLKNFLSKSKKGTWTLSAGDVFNLK